MKMCYFAQLDVMLILSLVCSTLSPFLSQLKSPQHLKSVKYIHQASASQKQTNQYFLVPIFMVECVCLRVIRDHDLHIN